MKFIFGVLNTLQNNPIHKKNRGTAPEISAYKNLKVTDLSDHHSPPLQLSLQWQIYLFLPV